MSKFNYAKYAAGLAPATETVTLHSVDRTPAIEALEVKIDAARGAEKKKLEAERDEHVKAMQEGAIEVTLRGMTSSELLQNEALDGVERAAAMIQTAAVEPEFDADGARWIVENLPDAEFGKASSAIQRLTFTEVRTPDFSQRG